MILTRLIRTRKVRVSTRDSMGLIEVRDVYVQGEPANDKK